LNTIQNSAAIVPARAIYAQLENTNLIDVSIDLSR
jgi:hypothetical protein